MRVDFLSCVHNGMPFIKHHLEVFKRLKIPWTWHIYEGVSRNIFKADTIHGDMHYNGLSIDGTTQYLKEIALNTEGDRVQLYDMPHGWETNYLTDRFARMLKWIEEPTIAWELDVDEYWTTEQIETMVRMFEENPTKTAAWFLCRYFVGPRLMLLGRNCAGNNCSYEWKRVWRHIPGMLYVAHDPPRVIGDGNFVSGAQDVFHANPFTHEETEKAVLVFNHYAYVTQAQLKFKERRYGFRGMLDEWQAMNTDPRWNNPACEVAPLRFYFTHLGDGNVTLAPQEHWFTEQEG